MKYVKLIVKPGGYFKEGTELFDPFTRFLEPVSLDGPFIRIPFRQYVFRSGQMLDGRLLVIGMRIDPETGKERWEEGICFPEDFTMEIVRE